MRKIQKIIIIVYGFLVAVACIYVPWERTLSNNIPESLGYSLMWRPVPMDSLSGPPIPLYSSVDIKRVILELIALTAVFGILFVLTLRPEQKEN